MSNFILRTKKMLRRLLFLLLFLGCVKADEPPQVVILTTVTQASLTPSLTGVGTFTAYNDVVLKAETCGRIEDIHFKEGDHVKPGQKLFTLYNGEQTAALNKANASLTLRKHKLARNQKLKEKDFISSQTLEELEAEVAEKEADLAFAQEDFAKTLIVAPFEGVLSRRKVSRGAFVQEGDELVRIQDLAPIRLAFQLPQTDIPKVKLKDKVTATTDVYPEKIFEGVVEAIEPSVNEATRSVTVYASFDNTEELLIPGLYTHVKLGSAQKTMPSLVIPEQALLIRQDGSYVYKQAGDKAVLTKVTLGTRTNDQAEVLSGLQVGDQIVLEGQNKIHDGSVIQVKGQ